MCSTRGECRSKKCRLDWEKNLDSPSSRARSADILRLASIAIKILRDSPSSPAETTGNKIYRSRPNCVTFVIGAIHAATWCPRRNITHPESATHSRTGGAIDHRNNMRVGDGHASRPTENAPALLYVRGTLREGWRKRGWGGGGEGGRAGRDARRTAKINGVTPSTISRPRVHSSRQRRDEASSLFLFSLLFNSSHSFSLWDVNRIDWSSAPERNPLPI